LVGAAARSHAEKAQRTRAGARTVAAPYLWGQPIYTPESHQLPAPRGNPSRRKKRKHKGHKGHKAATHKRTTHKTLARKRTSHKASGLGALKKKVRSIDGRLRKVEKTCKKIDQHLLHGAHKMGHALTRRR
jgi:hypothetical protein